MPARVPVLRAVAMAFFALLVTMLAPWAVREAAAEILVSACIEEIQATDVIYSWSYDNTTARAVVLSAGTIDNFFLPAPPDRGQPSTFEPGFHPDVFRTVFPRNSTLRWTLASVATSACESGCGTPACVPVLNARQLACQMSIGIQAGHFATSLHQALDTCFSAVLRANRDPAAVALAAAACTRSVDLTHPSATLTRARGTAAAAIGRSCAGVTPAQLENTCGGGVATIAELASCVLDQSRAAAAHQVGVEYGAACDILSNLSLNGSFPEACGP